MECKIIHKLKIKQGLDKFLTGRFGGNFLLI